MQQTLIEMSDTLHERVQRFAAGSGDASFEELALDIARFQARFSDGFARLLARRGGVLTALDDIPAVPADAFRLTRVATFPEALTSARFFTSGTTGTERGTHELRRVDTYERLSSSFGRAALLPEEPRRMLVVALAPKPNEPPTSSLGYMMARFMEAFDGQPLDETEQQLEVSSEARWLLDETGVNLAGLRRAGEASVARGEPVLLLGTAFALVRLVDQLGSEQLPLPAGSVVMQTGGFKGKTREVTMEELRASVSAALGVPPARVVGEYGMTELTSQLYEATITESALGREHASAEPGTYFEPPWLRVTPVDPVSLRPTPDGTPGLARFIDLGNVDSALSVVTQDLVVRSGGGVRLLGRQPGAPARGCSLAIEALLGG